MIAAVTRLHERVRGIASDGRAFCASDPELLEWVHATACFGFLEAYHAYVQPLAALERDRFYSESGPQQCCTAPGRHRNRRQRWRLCSLAWCGQLQRSDIVFDFLRIMRRVPALPVSLAAAARPF
jgi:uncharacterized protein (DUF2236 family)